MARTLPPGPVEAEAGRNDYPWPREGVVPRAEVERGPLFERSDKDRNGELSREEFLSNFAGARRPEGETRFRLSMRTATACSVGRIHLPRTMRGNE
jgi:hypothetical protein